VEVREPVTLGPGLMFRDSFPGALIPPTLTLPRKGGGDTTVCVQPPYISPRIAVARKALGVVPRVRRKALPK
jgi:hypothetical protein